MEQMEEASVSLSGATVVELAMEKQELTLSMRQLLKDVLLKEQDDAHGNALVLQRPEKWMGVASMMINGCSLRSARKEYGMTYQAVKKIQESVLFHEGATELKKMLAASAARDISDAAELKESIMDQYMNDSEKRAELTIKDYQLLSVSQKLDSERLLRFTGDNVQRIEVKHITTPEEAMSLIDSLPKAEVIDIDDE